MMKWIRWRGLVACIGIIIVLSGLWFLFIDSFVERMIEKRGSRIVGAKVELADADLSLFPAGLTLKGLQVTDPEEPMKNAFEIDRATFSIDTLNLFRRKAIINEMTLDGLRLDTSRKTSGALPSRTTRAPAVSKEGSKKEFKVPLFEVPNVGDVLKKEDLKSLRLVESLRADIKREKDNWRDRVQGLPDKKKVDEYKARIDRIKKARNGGIKDILNATSEAAAIRKDLKHDIKNIKGVQKEFKASRVLLKERLNQVANAPDEDVHRLKEKYSLSPKGIGNMTQILFGQTVGHWVERGLIWYKRLKPVLERAKEMKKDSEVIKPLRARGTDVRFKEYEPLPDFLIRNTKAGFKLQGGTMTGEVKNITPDQDILGAPLDFVFSGKSLKDIQSIRVTGTLDHIVPSNTKDAVNFRVKGYHVQDTVLSDSARLPVTLKNGLMDLDGHLAISAEKFRIEVKSTVKSATLKVGVQDETNLLATSIRSALSEISGFTLCVDVYGSLDKYDMRVTSDLDEILKKAVRRLVQAQVAQFEKELKAAILERIGTPLKELDASLTELGTIDKEIDKRINQLDGVLGDVSARSLLGNKKFPF
ncbi:MAG: TIGR03545 family protein [Thermodesulfobacteriota bacterium]|nr:TIGR03545 family protein [Thermodesulfobacteriota bacterium]